MIDYIADELHLWCMYITSKYSSHKCPLYCNKC